MGTRSRVAGLLGQLFLQKIQNGGRRFTLDWLVSRVKKVIQHFYWLIRLSGFYLGQSYLATLVTPQNCTKCLEILLLLYKLHILASDQKKVFCFFSSNFWGTFVCFLSNFFEKYGKLFEKSRAACGKPNHSWLTSSHNGKEICYRDFIHKVKIELLKEKLYVK